MEKETTIGILGGGQLGQMLCQAAKNLQLKTIIYTPESSEPAPAERFCDEIIYGDFFNENSLKSFAEKVDIITFEFENIPVESIKFLENLKPVRPNSNSIYVTQNRLREKTFLKQNNLPIHQFWEISEPSQITKAFEQALLQKAILKTSAFGYDGKGQKLINKGDDFTKAWNSLDYKHAVLEDFVPFAFEISIVLARDLKGNIEIFPIGKNMHQNGILKESILPSKILDKTKNQAIESAIKIIETLDYIGAAGVEFFVLETGDVYVNEIAPRVHNSGHWTQNGCNISQFEQHLRAIANLELQTPELSCNNVRMINLIGEEILDIPKYEGKPNNFIHNYGKQEIKPGRKMGHVNVVDCE